MPREREALDAADVRFALSDNEVGIGGVDSGLLVSLLDNMDTK